jgi:predicted peptidase
MFATIATCTAITPPTAVFDGGHGATAVAIGYPNSLRANNSRLIAEISSNTPRSAVDARTRARTLSAKPAGI